MIVWAVACVAVGLVAGAVVGALLQRRRDDLIVEQLLDEPASAAAEARPTMVALARRTRAAEAGRLEARAAEERLAAVLDGFAQAVVLFDRSDRAVYANRPGAALLAGRHGEALVMAAVRELLDVVARGEPSATRRLELTGPPRQSFEIVVRQLSVDERIAIVEDVTERRRLEEVRRDFVANISHELKTPIGAMALLAEAMTMETSPEMLSRLAQRMQSEALRVSMTIDDLLLLSRIEADDQPARELLELEEVVGEAVGRITQAAEARAIEIVCELPELPERSLRARGDRRQLVSAVYNLLENAAKYSDEGSVVRVGVRRRGGDVEIEIVDHGVGIPARDLERVFERFYRVDRARSRTTGGTGLGLAIVRHVAQNHGGEVRVRSIEGEGSTFTLAIPAEPGPEPRPNGQVLNGRAVPPGPGEMIGG